MNDNPENKRLAELGTALGITASIFVVAAGGFIAARRALDERSKDTEEGETDETV